MKEIVNGYELLEPFQNQNAGFSRWTFARKEGRLYFLKEFMDPIYPMGGELTDELRNRRINACRIYEEEKSFLYGMINDAADGNLIRVTEFFRVDSHYYIATPKVSGEDKSFAEIASLPVSEKVLLCKSAAHTLMKLHEKRIVHADVKDSNVLLKTTRTGKLVAKLIDFGCSFFEKNPPETAEDLGGDQIYLSPEACQFICGEDIRLTCKMDVFALGLLFHQYFTGELPGFDHREYDYAYEAVLDDQVLEVSKDIPAVYREIIEKMLKANPYERVDSRFVYNALNAWVNEPVRTAPTPHYGKKEAFGGSGIGEKADDPNVHKAFHYAGDL